MFVSQKMGFSDLHSQSVSFYPRVLFLPKLDEPVTELSAVQILLDVQVDIFKMFGAQHFFRDVNVLQMDYSFIYKCKDLSFDHFFRSSFICKFSCSHLDVWFKPSWLAFVDLWAFFTLVSFIICSEGILFVLFYVLPPKKSKKKLNKPSQPLIRLNWIGKSIIQSTLDCMRIG